MSIFKRNKEKKNKKDKKVSTLQFYIDLLFEWREKGENDIPSDLKDGYFYYTTQDIITKKRIKRIYFISEFPIQVETGFLDYLRNKVKDYGELVVREIMAPYALRLDSWQFKRRTDIWKIRWKSYQNRQSQRSQIEEVFKSDDDKFVDNRTERMINSWDYIMRSRDLNKEFCKTIVILEFVAKNMDKFKKGNDVLREYLNHNNVKFKNTFLLTNEYYKSYSPMSDDQPTMLKKMNGTNILTDETVSRLLIPKQGIVGDDSGVYCGTDIFTAYPVAKDFRKTPDAVNLLVAAKTGEGKSGLMKGIITHLRNENYVVVVNDYEGDEYDPITKVHGGIKLGIGGDGFYYDPVEIGELTSNDKENSTLYSQATSATKMLFNIICDENNGMTTNEVSIFSKAIGKFYNGIGVFKELPETYHKTRGASIFNFYELIKGFESNPEFIERYGKELTDFVNKLGIYLDDDGSERDKFNKRISISEIKNSNFIQFSFGMRGVADIALDKKDLAIKQLTVGSLSTQIANYNKYVRSLFTAQIYEEVQRYGTVASSMSILSNDITGGRKRDKIIFLVTNAPEQLMNVQIQSEDDKRRATLMSNITGAFLGRLTNPEVRTKLSEVLQMEQALPDLDRIGNGDPELKYSFVLKMDDEVTVIRYSLPPSLVHTPLYQTRREHKEVVE